MATPVNDPQDGPINGGTKVSIRCATCGRVVGKAYVLKGHVLIGPRSAVDNGIRNAPEDCFQLQCCGDPVTMARYDLAKLAEARAARPKGGSGRSIRIGPAV